MKSSGRSPHQILTPMIAIAAIAAALHFFVNEVFTVDAQRALEAWQRSHYGADPPPPADQREDVWVEAGDRYVHAARIVRADGLVRLSDVLMFDRQPNGRLKSVITAASGELSGGGGVLRDVREIAPAADEARGRPEMPWRPGFEADRFFDGPTVPAQLGAAALLRRIDDADAAGRQVPSLRAALYQKFTWPMASLVMPLLAALAGFAKGRNDHLALRLAAGLALGFSYFVVESLAMAFGRSGAIPPALGAMLPPILFFLIAEYILLRSEH